MIKRSNMKKIYINVEDFETNVAIADDGRIANYFSEKNIYAKNGNVYKGRISKVVKSMNFVFVEIGDDKPAFLSEKEYFETDGKDAGREEDGTDSMEITADFEKGQEVMVQVIKEPYNTKGARVTTNVTLPGQHIVFAPFIKHLGVSKRITDDNERFRLKNIVKKVRAGLGEDFGIIVRTNASGVSEEELTEEIKHYHTEWLRIKNENKKFKSPKLLYKEHDLSIKVLREYVDDLVEEIIVDDEAVYGDVKRYIDETSRKHVNVKYYNGAGHLFEHFGIKSQVDGIYNNIVSFKKGGYIKVDVTEALTVVDINSGKFKGDADVESSLLQLNLNAAKEVARQIILRNIGGLIVVDFIDMLAEENRARVKQVMEEELSKSKMYFKCGKISEFGLMEITRK
ncbi:MAG: Rne/Rng family ribonuclease, partial [Spirochaetia bacterium]|nr:Rne/Rng family ribonuclease [Spirochaetia bacterium]